MNKNMNSITFNHSRLAGYATIIAATFLTGCVNQNTLAEQTLAPISNPCQKITMLANAYKTNFETLKQSEVKSRASNIWQAKYHLVGNNCKIWSFGANNATYSCNTIEVEQQSAQKYYQNAKETIQQCLGDDWRLTESKRNHDDGLKAEYVNEINDLTISTHLVPSTGVFKSKWSVYYYIGNVDR